VFLRQNSSLVKLVTPQTVQGFNLVGLLKSKSEVALKLCLLLLRHNDEILMYDLVQEDGYSRDLILKF
jgi:hypothetical protein